MRAALDAGMNWIDTAEVYGQGHSEELVAKAVEGHRDEVLIFTKVAPDDEGSGIQPAEIRGAIRDSLRRLRTDHVDLYQVHWSDDRIPVEETWGTMVELADEGLARHIGVSNFDRSLVERCLALRHVDSVQNAFSLLEQETAEMLPWLLEQGVGFLAYGPLGFGLLTGGITADTTFAEGDWRREERRGREGLFGQDTFERSLRLVDALRGIGDRLDTPTSVIALRWALQQKGVTGVIAGSRNPEHVRQNGIAGEMQLDEATLEAIDKMFLDIALEETNP